MEYTRDTYTEYGETAHVVSFEAELGIAHNLLDYPFA